MANSFNMRAVSCLSVAFMLVLLLYFGGQWIVGAVGLATIFNATMLFITSLLMVGALALCFFGGLDLVRMGGAYNMLGGTICFMLFFGLAFGIARLCFCF